MAVSDKTRWIAAISGCFIAVTGIILLSYLSVIVSSSLIVGAGVAGLFPRHGRALMWFGTVIVSLWAIPVVVAMSQLSLNYDGTAPGVIAVAVWSLLLVIWCDVTIAREAIELRRVLGGGSNQRLTTND